MRVAAIHIDEIQGIFSGKARCYRLDPPLPDPDGGKDIEYITINVMGGRRRHQLPEVAVFASTPEHGAPRVMKRLPGSYVLYNEDEDPIHAYGLALMQIGVTKIVGSIPEPLPDMPDGLDYDPDEYEEE